MISIVIPTYKNKEQLFRNLNRNRSFFKNHEVIIINDYPEDNLSDSLKEFQVIQNSTNLGFGPSVNKGVEAAKNNYVMLLNSDVLLSDSSYEKALSHFEKDESLFAVSFAQKEADQTIVGRNTIFWKEGMLHHSSSEISFGYNAWAEGGACIVDRAKFLQLSGFDYLYSPFYWEDLDLSYRAWKAGYKVMFDPDIQVEHYHESTIGKYFQKSQIDKVAYRNQFQFIWKNITDANIFINHLYYLPYNLFYYGVIKRQPQFIQGFFSALKNLKTILQQRKKLSSCMTDKQVLALFQNIHV